MAFPRPCRKLVCVRRHLQVLTSLCFHVPKVGILYSTRRRLGPVYPLPIPSHCLLSFRSRPFGKSLEQWLEGEAALVGQPQRPAGGPGRRGRTMNQATLMQSMRPRNGVLGQGRWLLILGLGAPRQTTSPPLSAESLCPHRWLSGQCPGPADMK